MAKMDRAIVFQRQRGPGAGIPSQRRMLPDTNYQHPQWQAASINHLGHAGRAFLETGGISLQILQLGHLSLRAAL